MFREPLPPVRSEEIRPLTTVRSKMVHLPTITFHKLQRMFGRMSPDEIHDIMGQAAAVRDLSVVRTEFGATNGVTKSQFLRYVERLLVVDPTPHITAAINGFFSRVASSTITMNALAELETACAELRMPNLPYSKIFNLFVRNLSKVKAWCEVLMLNDNTAEVRNVQSTFKELFKMGLRLVVMDPDRDYINILKQINVYNDIEEYMSKDSYFQRYVLNIAALRTELVNYLSTCIRPQFFWDKVSIVPEIWWLDVTIHPPSTSPHYARVIAAINAAAERSEDIEYELDSYVTDKISEWTDGDDTRDPIVVAIGEALATTETPETPVPTMLTPSQFQTVAIYLRVKPSGFKYIDNIDFSGMSNFGGRAQDPNINLFELARRLRFLRDFYDVHRFHNFIHVNDFSGPSIDRERKVWNMICSRPEFNRNLPLGNCEFYALPVLDWTAPSPAQLSTLMLNIISMEGSAGHCASGFGRTGTYVLTALVLALGADSMSDAISMVREYYSADSAHELSTIYKKVIIAMKVDEVVASELSTNKSAQKLVSNIAAKEHHGHDTSKLVAKLDRIRRTVYDNLDFRTLTLPESSNHKGWPAFIHWINRLLHRPPTRDMRLVRRTLRRLSEERGTSALINN